MRKINPKKFVKNIVDELYDVYWRDFICSPLTHTAKTKLVKDNEAIIDFVNGQRFKITVTEIYTK